MKRHSRKTIDAVREMRSRGRSLPEIMQKYGLSKTTAWHHIKNIELSEEAWKVLRARGGVMKGEHVRQRAQKFAIKVFKGLDVTAVWPVIIAALYWCEGTKRSGFVFTNTDPNMIRVFLAIMRGKLGISNGDLDILIRTCKPMEPNSCRRYWSGVTDVPFKSVRINHHDTHNRSKTKYGICRITLKKGNFYLKVMHCLISLLTDKMIPAGKAPVAQWIEFRSPNAAM